MIIRVLKQVLLPCVRFPSFDERDRPVPNNPATYEKVHHHRCPGAGKTAIIRHLELDGFSVVEEAATDVIAAAQTRGTAEPWIESSFIDAIADLQMQRLIRSSYQPDDVQFHDRSAICTAALAVYLGYEFSTLLMTELERVRKEAIFEKRVFLVRNLGFVTPTAARRISYEETLRFERIHEDTYRGFGFEVVPVEPGGVLERVNVIKSAISDKPFDAGNSFDLPSARGVRHRRP